MARERYFAELLQSIYSRHSSVLLMMARSAYELRGIMKDTKVSITKVGAAPPSHVETVHLYETRMEFPLSLVPSLS